MDRQINYPGQVPLETDLLKSNQNIMVGLSKLALAMFGATAGFANGFATTQTTVPSLAVSVAAGEIYSLQSLEATAISSLAADTTHQVVKQGISLDAQTIAITPPGTAGFSINYLIQVGYQDSDSGSTVLPYYNASNPSVAYSGPANSGTAQPTVRQGIAVISAKAGTAATTGTQTTPAPDSGKIGLYVVTVANGAASVVNANISAYSGAPILSQPLTQGRFLSRQVIATTATITPPAGASFGNCIVVGGGGGGGGGAATGAGQVSAGAGGGGGGWAMKKIAASILAGLTATVGAGGAGGVIAAGTAGGTSSIGAQVTATGGGGGALGAASSPANQLNGSGAQGAGANGDINYVGGIGQYAVYAANPISGQGGGSYGGASGAPWVVGGYVSGLNASGYGGGGSGGAGTASTAGTTGGAGFQGVIIIDWYS